MAGQDSGRAPPGAGCSVVSVLTPHRSNRVQLPRLDFKRSDIHGRCQILGSPGRLQDHDGAPLFVAHGVPPVLVLRGCIGSVHTTHYPDFGARLKGKILFIALRRFAHPPQGFIPTAFVIFATVSPSPRDLPNSYRTPQTHRSGKSSGARLACVPHCSQVNIYTALTVTVVPVALQPPLVLCRVRVSLIVEQSGFSLPKIFFQVCSSTLELNQLQLCVYSR